MIEAKETCTCKSCEIAGLFEAHILELKVIADNFQTLANQITEGLQAITPRIEEAQKGVPFTHTGPENSTNTGATNGEKAIDYKGRRGEGHDLAGALQKVYRKNLQKEREEKES